MWDGHLACAGWKPTPQIKLDCYMIKTRTIKIVDYYLQWSLVFNDLKRVLETALGKLALSIEHVGSTSVPGLAAKPIIDLGVVIECNARLSGVIQSLYCTKIST